MNNALDKIPRILLYVLMAICIVCGLMFYAGGTEGSLEVAGDFLDIPRFTDLFLYWCYILVVLALVITLVVVLTNYIFSFKYTPKRAIRTLSYVCVFVLILVVSWFLGSPEELPIVGYEGTDNVGFWAQCTDMIIYSVYVLVVAVVATIIGAAIYVKFRK